MRQRTNETKEHTEKQNILIGCLIVTIVVLILIIFSITIGWKVVNHLIISYDGILSGLEVVITGGGLFSILFAVRQMHADHERSRREKTLDMIMRWSCELSPEANFAVKIVEKFDKDQCRALVNMEPFEVEKQVYDDIKELYDTKKDIERENQKGCDTNNNHIGKTERHFIISNIHMCKRKFCEIKTENSFTKGDGKDNDNRRVTIEGYYLKKLRFSIIKYLNILESILVGWQNGILDEDVIEVQFSYLYNPTKDKKCLENIRNATGSETNYPAIEMFLIKLEEKRKSRLLRKGKVD